MSSNSANTLATALEGSPYRSLVAHSSLSVASGTLRSMSLRTASIAPSPPTRRSSEYPAPCSLLRRCMGPRQRNFPATMIPARWHSASHSSMLCDVRTTARPRHVD